MSTVSILFVVVVIGGALMLCCVACCLFALLAVRMKAGSANGKWKPPVPIGEPKPLRVIRAGDKPLAESARWDGDELVIQADAAATKCLFEVALDGLKQCMITYRFRIQTENLGKPVYPEMWCRIPDKGEFFSRGLQCKLRGTNDWTPVEIPFYLESGQRADHLRLNLVFEGPGTVRLRDIEVLSTPVKPTS